jgi:hypothetical protein
MPDGVMEAVTTASNASEDRMMGFDAAGVRAASTGFAALAERAAANGSALLRSAHASIRLPEDGVAGSVRANAAAFLGSAEGKAAVGQLFASALAVLRGIATGPAPGAPAPNEGSAARPQPLA